MANRSRPGTQVKQPPPKKKTEFDADDYVKPTLPREEVLEIKVPSLSLARTPSISSITIRAAQSTPLS
jgi:hypothetical protein